MQHHTHACRCCVGQLCISVLWPAEYVIHCGILHEHVHFKEVLPCKVQHGKREDMGLLGAVTTCLCTSLLHFVRQTQMPVAATAIVVNLTQGV